MVSGACENLSAVGSNRPAETLSDHLCECGCGQFTALIGKTSARQGRTKGEPNRFIYGHARGWKHPNPPPATGESPEARERRLAHHRERYAAGGEELRAQLREYYAQNVEKMREKSRRLHAKYRVERLQARREKYDPEKNSVAGKAWREANPDRARELGRRSEINRRARKKGVFVEAIDPFIVLERDDGVCGICGDDVDPTNYHVDHVVAIVNGGEHSYANVQAAHPACNMRKGWSR